MKAHGARAGARGVARPAAVGRSGMLSSQTDEETDRSFPRDHHAQEISCRASTSHIREKAINWRFYDRSSLPCPGSRTEASSQRGLSSAMFDRSLQ